MVAKAFARVVPATTKVLVRTDAGAGAMNGGLAAGGGVGGPGGTVGGTGAGTGARRMTRSKHGLGGPAMALSPRRKRSRCAPAAVGRVLASQRGQERPARSASGAVASAQALGGATSSWCG